MSEPEAAESIPENRKEKEQMIKVAIEVHSGAARMGVTVQAQSIERALSLVGGRFPGKPCRVKFPIEPEVFFVEGAGAREGMVEQPKEMAA